MFKVAVNFTHSLFFTQRDRINIVFYGKDTAYYSIGLKDKVDYLVMFPADLEVLVPGGYGKYRVGGLGKLVELEKKSDILGKTFSLNTSSFVDAYFYPGDSQIFFGDNNDVKSSRPGFLKIFFERGGASLFDRLYIYSLFMAKSKYSFKEITDLPIVNESGSPFLSSIDFSKQYQGFFYQSSYRMEERTVQIKYTKSYITTQYLSSILEGEGVRVVDLDQVSYAQKSCLVVENLKQHSVTAKAISSFFGCRLETGDTKLSDIIFILGNKEKEWGVE